MVGGPACHLSNLTARARIVKKLVDFWAERVKNAFGSDRIRRYQLHYSRFQDESKKRVCAESNLLEQLSIYFRRMTGKLTNAGTHSLPGVLGKRTRLIKSFMRLGDPVRWACPAVTLTSRTPLFTTRVPHIRCRKFAEYHGSTSRAAITCSI